MANSNGKGDRPRPMKITMKEWKKNWNKIFRKNDAKEKCNGRKR